METLEDLVKIYYNFLRLQDDGIEKDCFFCGRNHPTDKCPNIEAQDAYWEIPPVKETQNVKN